MAAEPNNINRPSQPSQLSSVGEEDNRFAVSPSRLRIERHQSGAGET
jgi:hypothetical protein